MQVILIITAFIIAIAMFFFSYIRIKKLKAAAESIYDPKLRTPSIQSISIWVFILICSASLISLIWLFGSYGKLLNYEGGFKLKSAANWQLTENRTEDSEQYYKYAHNNNIVLITVVSLSKENVREKKAEIIQVRDNLITSLKAEPKRLKESAKNAERNLKIQARENRKEIRTAFRKDRLQRNLETKANREQLKNDIVNIKIELEQDLKNNRKNIRDIWHNGWLQKDLNINCFTAIKNRRLYTVEVTLRGDLSGINIGPYGIFNGIFDGSIFPCTVFIARNNVFMYPYKEVNNGFSYVLGFILGNIIFLAFAVWFIYIIAAKIIRERWKKLWLVLPTGNKVAYITALYNGEQEFHKQELEYCIQQSKNKYYSCKKELDMSPDKALVLLNAPDEEKGKLWKIGDTISAGSFSKNEAEEKYNKMKMVYDYYDSEFNIASVKVDTANTHYNFICRKAVLYIQQMKELIKKFTYEQKNQFDQAKQLEFDTFNEVNIQEILKSIEAFNNDFYINSKAMWKDTLRFVNTVNSIGRLGTFGTALGIGFIAVAAIVQFFSAANNNKEIKARYMKGQSEIRNAITQSKENKLKAENFVKRADEISNYLEESMIRYTAMFEKINTELFPADDIQKSKISRGKREKKGESYYTEDEILKIMPLGKYARIMSRVIESDL